MRRIYLNSNFLCLCGFLVSLVILFPCRHLFLIKDTIPFLSISYNFCHGKYKLKRFFFPLLREVPKNEKLVKLQS